MKRFFILFLTLNLTGCCYFLYRPDIQQGNVISYQAFQQLKPGMTQTQVLYIMGTPALIHTFNPQRWDYVYTFRKGTGLTHEKRFYLYFDQDRLVKISGIEENLCPTY